MRKCCLLFFLFLYCTKSFSQNVGIGTAAPTTRLHVVSTISNVATFSGANQMYITLAEGTNNRGYIGSYAGNPEDIDFGTYGGNATGKLHLTIQDIPKLTVNASGNIGIGTTDPLSLLHVSNGPVLFDGTTGAVPVTGAGIRMMWVPAKKAFRAGEVTGTQWDDANIGPWSFASGYNNQASGFMSVAMGNSNSANGDYSLALGTNSVADGNSSVAFGVGTRAKAWSSAVVGSYNDSTNASTTCCNDPLNRVFQVGNGSNNFTRSNAMTVLQNGKVGIGTTAPAQLLDVNGGIKIGNTATTGAGSIRYSNGKFEGHNGTAWTSFDQLPTGTLVSSPIYPNTSLQNAGFTFQGVMPSIYMQQTVTGVAADTWIPTSTQTVVSPDKRERHTSVWTGTEMICWGGDNGSTYLNTGARYSPGNNSWQPISTVNAPVYREGHTAVWTGTDMLIWGGVNGATAFTDGGKYNPLTDSWTVIASNSSIGYLYHTAIWTGGLMIVWGGLDIGTGDPINSGARYNPGNNTWTATSTVNAPTPRTDHTAIWTGTEMIIWGGYDAINLSTLNTGAKYNPSTNTWTTMSTVNAPAGRMAHTAVWTGTEMIVWGGSEGLYSYNAGTGARYNPSTNTWTPIAFAPASRYYHTAIWTGSDMIIWGGRNGTTVFNDGAKYNPSANTWTSISVTNTPSKRQYHTAVWTGNQMIVFGGNDNGGTGNTTVFDSGGRYFPVAQPAYNTINEVSSSLYLYSKQ